LNGYADSTPFADLWKQEKLNPAVLEDEGVTQILKNRHVFFVSGLMSEYANLINNYYSDNIKVVRKEYHAKTTYYSPSSSVSIPKNAAKLHIKIKENYDRGGQKPLIVIGHSKGGAELLYMIFEHPELILDGVIDRVVLIQSAIGGSPLVENPSFRMKATSCFSNPNFKTLRPSVANKNFKHAYKVFHDFLDKEFKIGSVLYLEKYQEISNKIFYFRSAANPESEAKQISTGIKFVLAMVGKKLDKDRPNDGLLYVEDQIFPEIGIDLGILESDHTGFTGSSFSATKKKDRKAFTRALFKKIFETELISFSNHSSKEHLSPISKNEISLLSL
jgi:hypothetical protein